ncbi:MAG: hypothetical protein KAH32_08520 [Chlamydiia bacterium]|nr:hypothetical protein [Chlamydiia bacterium]
MNLLLSIKEKQKLYLHIVNNTRLIKDCESRKLKCLLNEIEFVKSKCDKNSTFTYPNATVLTDSAFSTSELLFAGVSSNVSDLIIKLKRKECYSSISNIRKLINQELENRNLDKYPQKCELNAIDLADIAMKYGLLKFMDKTSVVDMVREIREEAIVSEPKNTSLYKKL